MYILDEVHAQRFGSYNKLSTARGSTKLPIPPLAYHHFNTFVICETLGISLFGYIAGFYAFCVPLHSVRLTT